MLFFSQLLSTPQGAEATSPIRGTLNAMSFPKYLKKKTYSIIRRNKYGIENR